MKFGQWLAVPLGYGCGASIGGSIGSEMCVGVVGADVGAAIVPEVERRRVVIATIAAVGAFILSE